MNLLNYIDRYSFFAVGTQIQDDLHINNRGYGFLSASFMIVYTIVSPLVGWLGDRYNRRALLAFGVGLWSVATVGTAFSRGFSDMFFWRALLGVGEASYGVDRADAAGRPVRAEGPGPGDRASITWHCRWAGRWVTGSAAGLATAGAGRRRSGSSGCPGLLAAVGGPADPRPRPGRVGGAQARRQGRPAQAAPTISTCSGRRRFVYNTAGHGGRHVRHRGVCRLGLDLLPDGPRHDRDTGAGSGSAA